MTRRLPSLVVRLDVPRGRAPDQATQCEVARLRDVKADGRRHHVVGHQRRSERLVSGGVSSTHRGRADNFTGRRAPRYIRGDPDGQPARSMRITAAAAQPQIFPLTVAGAKGGKEPAELAVPAALIQKWPALASLEGAPAYNVGSVYAAFAADMANGTHTVPDFADAVRRHEVIAAIESSASSGERVKA